MQHHLLHQGHGEYQNSIASMFGQTRYASPLCIYAPKILGEEFKMKKKMQHREHIRKINKKGGKSESERIKKGEKKKRREKGKQTLGNLGFGL